MRKVPAAFLCAVLLVCTVSCASAQVVSCPEAHLSMTVPDSWTVVPLSGSGDPDLCLLLQDNNISLSVIFMKIYVIMFKTYLNGVK